MLLRVLHDPSPTPRPRSPVTEAARTPVVLDLSEQIFLCQQISVSSDILCQQISITRYSQRQSVTHCALTESLLFIVLWTQIYLYVLSELAFYPIIDDGETMRKRHKKKGAQRRKSYRTIYF